MRELSYELKSLLATSRVESHSVMELTLLSAMGMRATYYFATADLTINGIRYESRLRIVGDRTQSLTRASDQVEIQIENVSLILGPQWVNNFDEFYGADCQIKRYFENIDTGHRWLVPWLSGVVRGTGQADENTVQLSILSDLYAKSVGGGRRVTRKCQWRFNYPAGVGPQCGYSGNETTCNKLLNSTGGCSGRANTHRYGGYVYMPSSSTVSAAEGLSVPAVNQLVKTDSATLTQRTSIRFDDVSPSQISDSSVLNATRVNLGAPGDWLNVRAYGAVGDGIADDTTAIQNAVNAAQSGARKTVYFPAGIFRTQGISVAGRVNLLGGGRANSIIYSVTNAVIVDMVGDVLFRGGSVQNLTIRGNVGGGSNQIGLRIDDPTFAYGFLVRDVRIEDCGSHGLAWYKGFSSRVEELFVTNCVNYPILYDASNMPTNIFDSVYVGDMRSTGLVAFRIKRGTFTGKNLNGINTINTGSIFMRIGRKNGVDGDSVNDGAMVVLEGSNAESWHTTGFEVYSFSVLELYNTTIIGSGLNANQIGIYCDLAGAGGVVFFEQFILRSKIHSSCNFADGAAAYKNSQPIHATTFLPMELHGPGYYAGGVHMNTYRETTLGRSYPMSRLDGRPAIENVNATITYPHPGPTCFAVNSSGGALTLTIPWAGWYREGKDRVVIKDVGGLAATNNITINAVAGTIDGAGSIALANNRGSVTLIPDGNTGAGNWIVETVYP